MEVSIASALAARLPELAAASPAAEICGLLLGCGGDRIDALLPAENVASDPARAFELCPATLFAALRAERAGGARILGHYHSHPSGLARPSRRDAAAADGSGAFWLIVAGGTLTLWRAVAGGPTLGAFEPATLRIDM